MRLDPVLRGQLLVRRTGEILRPSSEKLRRVGTYDEEELGVEYERGERAVAQLVERIERFTGADLEPRRVLDFGCGFGRLALPLAQRCAHVHGLDVSADVLRVAEQRAKSLGLTNVEWSDASRLSELHGSYDLAVSIFVFQHIPSREGERIFQTIVSGLAPGGVGAIHFTLRPERASVAPAAADHNGAVSGPGGLRRIHLGYLYMLVHSYSLNRIARLLAGEGITEWHVKWHQMSGRRRYPTAVVFFRKDD